MQYFIKQFEKSIKTRWNQAALDEFRTSSLTYGELAAKVVENHLFFEAVGLDRGDKVQSMREAAHSGLRFSCQLFREVM